MHKNLVRSILVIGIVVLGIIALVLWQKGNRAPVAETVLVQSNSEQSAETTSATETLTTNSQTIKTMQENPIIIFNTTKGQIELELFADVAPNTVKNFTDLASKGFYNGTRFHRVIEGFMIQGGDPLSKDDAMMARWGTGGPGYQFADEIHANNNNIAGTISMANAGPNTNGSQFFINTADNSFLDTKHTVFGKVVKGMDVVTAIENTPTGQADRPVDAITITSVTVK